MGIQVPVFVTSAKDEEKNWKVIFQSIKSLRKTSYLPKTAGNHGSRALWRKFKDSPGYWVAVSEFLKDYLPKTAVESSKEQTSKPSPAAAPPKKKEKPAPKERPRVE